MAEKKLFEKSLEELEKIVEALEGGELPLEDSIQRYEAGVKLLKECYQYLEKTEKRIQKLVKKEDGTFSLEPFEGEKNAKGQKDDATQ
jgi:exodeoxyribonuclease VII small subunit